MTVSYQFGEYRAAQIAGSSGEKDFMRSPSETGCWQAGDRAEGRRSATVAPWTTICAEGANTVRGLPCRVSRKTRPRDCVLINP